MSRYLPPPSPVVVDDRPDHTRAIVEGCTARVAITRGRRCLACEAWAPLHSTLRHVAGCRAGDCQ